MKMVQIIIVAVMMLVGGTAHLLKPEIFYPLIPAPFPPWLSVIASGVVELVIGIAVLFPRCRALAGLGFAALCLAYLPLHLWDFFRPDPIFKPPLVAGGRVIVQLLFIAIGLSLWRAGRPDRRH
jgi:uncharacterized membrane protein